MRAIKKSVVTWSLLRPVSFVFGLVAIHLLTQFAFTQQTHEPRVYKGQLPELADAAQRAMSAMPSQEQSQVQNGALVFPSAEYARKLGSALTQAARQFGGDLLKSNDILDLETQVPIASGQVLFRVIVARHGRDGEVLGAVAGEDGISVTGIMESRPGVILVVSAGDGGTGGCGRGGNGGIVRAKSLSRRGSLIAFGGHGGSGGARESVCAAIHGSLASARALDAEAQPDAEKVERGRNGEDGGDGGDAQAFTEECSLESVQAYGGNGGNGVVPEPGAPFPHNFGGHGGTGGTATADCGPSQKTGPCNAVAVGGNAGHGASGGNQAGDEVGGNGGYGGPPINGNITGGGGAAIAISCCGRTSGVNTGNASAVGGAGGNGGNGGNAVKEGGNGGNGSPGGSAAAITVPGFTSGTTSAVSGSGGNGGNGGNAITTAGEGGDGAVAGSVTAQNACFGFPEEHMTKGADGKPGTDGNKEKQ